MKIFEIKYLTNINYRSKVLPLVAIVFLPYLLIGCTEIKSTAVNDNGLLTGSNIRLEKPSDDNATLNNNDQKKSANNSNIVQDQPGKRDKITNKKDNKFIPEIILDRGTLPVGQIEHPYDLFPEYRITPGDVLDVLYQIQTWVEKDEFKIAVDHTVSVKFVHTPELNESQQIRPDGNISLPYLGEVYVINKTVVQLTKELRKEYSNILKNPELYVLVPDFRSGIKELKKDLHTAPRGLSRLVTVRPDGYVTFPMTGDIFVANKTIPVINEKLNEMYDDILPGLHCNLFLESHSGSVVYVVGQVEKPGAYKIIKPTTVIEAIALAEGYIPGAKLGAVVVARKEEGKIVATKINLKKVLALKEESKFFYLQPDDIVYVPKTIIKKVANVASDLSEIFFFRGWSTNLSWGYDLNRSSSSKSKSKEEDRESTLPILSTN